MSVIGLFGSGFRQGPQIGFGCYAPWVQYFWWWIQSRVSQGHYYWQFWLDICQGDRPMCYRISNILYLSLLEANGTSPCVTTRNVSKHGLMSSRCKIASIENHWSNIQFNFQTKIFHHRYCMFVTASHHKACDKRFSLFSMSEAMCCLPDLSMLKFPSYLSPKNLSGCWWSLPRSTVLLGITKWGFYSFYHSFHIY